MYLRCPNCSACTRVPLEKMVDATVDCVSCGRQHSTAGAGALGSTPESRYATALGFATENRIDLASAYSVLLGVMPLDRAFSVRADNPLEPPPEPPPIRPATPVTDEKPYDADFSDAVLNGFLTVRQAVERGDRALYASRLATRHGLSMGTALQVADNRIPLEAAMRRKAAIAAGERHSVKPEAAKPLVSRLGIACAAVVVVVCGAAAWRVASVRGGGDAEPTVAAARPVSSSPRAPVVPQAATEIHLDATGRPLAVKAPDPDSVLNAFCGSTTGTVVRAPEKVVRSGEEYVGYYTEAGIRYALRIHKEPTGYSAGTVAEPIRPEDLARK